MKTYMAADWIIEDLDVAFRLKTENGVEYKRRELTATLVKTCDAGSVATFGYIFTNAPSTYTDLPFQIGVSGDLPPLGSTLNGTWNTERLHTRFAGRVASVSLTVYQPNSTWIAVTEDSTVIT